VCIANITFDEKIHTDDRIITMKTATKVETFMYLSLSIFTLLKFIHFIFTLATAINGQLANF